MEVTYNITIDKVVGNPEYEAHIKKYGDGNPYHNPTPPATISIKKLETIVTEEEFKTIKKACLEIM